MTARTEPAHRALTPAPDPSRRPLVVAAALAGGAVVGAGLAVASLALPSPIGPGLVAALPLVVIAGGLALRDSRWAIALFAAALPAGLTTLFGGVQIIQVAAAAAVALVVLARLWRGRAPLVLTPAVVALLAFVAWSAVTVLVAPDLPTALRWLAVLVTGILLVAAVATVCGRDVTRLRSVAAVVCAGSVITCTIALPESTQRRSFGAAVVEGRAQGVFSQPNELGLFAGTTLVLALAIAIGASERRHRVLAGAGAIIALIALALSLSRGAWVGTLLALAVATATVPAVRRVTVGAVVVVAVAVVVMVGTATTPPQLEVVGARAALVADRGANPYDERPAIYEEAVRQVREHPVTGVGPASFPLASARSSDVVASVRPAHAHNVLLTFAAESGLPAVVALLAAIVALGTGLVRSWSLPGWAVRHRAFVTVLGCAPLVILGHGFLDAPIRNATTLLHTAAVLGLAVAVTRVRPTPTPETETTP